jgi:hypothetical protein
LQGLKDAPVDAIQRDRVVHLLILARILRH